MVFWGRLVTFDALVGKPAGGVAPDSGIPQRATSHYEGADAHQHNQTQHDKTQLHNRLIGYPAAALKLPYGRIGGGPEERHPDG